jgi:uncharacterized coiled-coil DUF342 family protein
LTVQDKTSEFESISKQISALREQVRNANSNIKGQVEKRDKLNEKNKKLHQEIRKFKTERDSLNEKVKTLKQQRYEARLKIREHITEIKIYNQKITELKKKISRESRRLLQREFDAIEWKIQTTSLDMEEEKRLMECVKQLETQLSVYKKIDQHVKRISELRKKVEAFEATADAAHHELTEIAVKSQDIHAKMIAKITESKDIKSEADCLHSNYVQTKEQVRPIREKIEKLIEQKRKLQVAMQEDAKKRKKHVEQALKEKLGSQAKDKLERGEKLSWNEFKMLVDDESKDSQA